MTAGAVKAVTGPDGTVYASHKAAGEALGVCRSAISYHVRRYGNLDRLGFYRSPASAGGQTFASLTETAKALGVSRATINWHLNRYGHLDHVGRPRSKRTWIRALQIGPVRWAARVDAARDLGVTARTLRKWTSKNATAEQTQRLYAAVMRVHAERQAAEREAQAEAERLADAEARRARARDRYRAAAKGTDQQGAAA